MNWETFYLICFVVGFAYTAFSFLSGTLHFHLHVPHHFHGGHGAGHSGSGTHHSSFGIFNPMTISVFLAWFGGTGYLLVHLRHIWVFAGLALSTLSGLVGAGLVFVFATKYFLAHESSLDPMDYEMVGVLGHVSGSIRGAALEKSFLCRKARAKPALPAVKKVKRSGVVKKLWSRVLTRV